MSNKCLITVSMGETFGEQAERMVRSFVAHNPDWDVLRYRDGVLDALLPAECKGWTPFNKCEIGRWYAMQDALSRHDTVLYADGDMRFYSEYPLSGHNICLFPHYITRLSRRNARHWTWKDGVANIGIMEISRGEDAELAFDFILGEVLRRPDRYKHGDQLWLQNIVSHLPECGCDCVWSNHAGINVASWNLRKGDREVGRIGGGYVVVTNEGAEFPLVSFHFSSKSLNSLDYHGEAVKELKEAYLNECKRDS